MKKIIYKTAVAASLVLLLFSMLLVMDRGKLYLQFRHAQSLYAAGSYAEAMHAFEDMGWLKQRDYCLEKLEEEEYRAAQELMRKENYIAAAAAFDAMGKYQDSQALAETCRYEQAKLLIGSKSYYGAAKLMSLIPEHPGVTELMDSIRPELYSQAVNATYSGEMEKAIEMWLMVGEYEDSSVFLLRCQRRQALLEADSTPKVLLFEQIHEKLDTATVYYTKLGDLYVPDECDKDTRFLVYFPGSYDQELPNGYYSLFMHSSAPNAIMLFLDANGWYDMKGKCEEIYKLFELTATEKQLFIHDMVVCGASLGVYPALQCVDFMFEYCGIPVRRALLFEAGLGWSVEDHLLTASQIEAVAAAGTELYLFQAWGVGMGKTAIRDMVNGGCKVIMVPCENAVHNDYPYDAVRLGIMDWSLSEGNPPEAGNYTYIPLSPGSTYGA